jgi:hypothetical protein
MPQLVSKLLASVRRIPGDWWHWAEVRARKKVEEDEQNAVELRNRKVEAERRKTKVEDTLRVIEKKIKDAQDERNERTGDLKKIGVWRRTLHALGLRRDKKLDEFQQSDSELAELRKKYSELAKLSAKK